MNDGEVRTAGLGDVRPTLTRPPSIRWMDAPMTLDGRGRTARTSDDEHVRDLIRSVLFTSPGERMNRPDFECALKTMVFLPNSDVLAAATRALVISSLQQWLGDVIVVDDVEVQAIDSELRVVLAYRRLSDGTTHRDIVSQRGGGSS